MAFPGYKLKKKIARGGMATVYLAIQEKFNRQVCLKIIADDDDDPVFRQRFHEEADIAGTLIHPNIITIYDVGQYKHYHYIAMEYLASGSLEKRISTGLSLADVLRITSEVASALACAHEKGYIHRDVKPDNILFRKAGEIVLTDFGIAKAYNLESKKTATGQVLGTPYYMSPEQAQAREIDARADIYSLGIVVYEMLTGTTPFRADDAVTVALKHINEPVPKLPRKLKKLQPLLDRMLAKNPRQRFQSADEVLQTCQQLTRKLEKKKGFNDTIEYLQRASQDSATVVQVQAPKRFKSALSIAATLLIIAGSGLAEYRYHWSDKLMPLLKDFSQQLNASNLATAAYGIDDDSSAATPGKAEKPARTKPQTLPLTVKTSPADASITIHNIQQKYRPGMLLSPGSYQLTVSHPGYHSLKTRIKLENDSPLTLELKGKAVGDHHQDSFDNGIQGPRMLFLPLQQGRPVAISATEITYERYRYYLHDNEQPLPDIQADKLKHPVADVSFHDAQAYAQWLSEKTGNRYRLPTEQEWQIAARAGTAGDYWWGEQKAEGKANCGRGCDSEWVRFFSSGSAPVAFYPANSWGFFDTAGNVAEWTDSCADEECGRYRVKGGSFKTGSKSMAINRHQSYKAAEKRRDLGFRLVVSF